MSVRINVGMSKVMCLPEKSRRTHVRGIRQLLPESFFHDFIVVMKINVVFLSITSK